jgi:O-acetyl-ADP-ribose deacetylase (regulator of RNase III)
MPFNIIRADITTLRVDAIVNAANTGLAMGGGVCGAIFSAAGARELQAACNKLAPIKTGEAVITPGFALPAKYVIHAAGPVYRDGKHGEEELLRAAYTNALKRAVENSCGSVAFPLISSGIYGYPKDEALRVATAAIRDFLSEHDIDVSLAVFDEKETEYLKRKDKRLGEAIDKIGHIDREVNTDLFSSVVHNIVGQQISSAALKTVWMRLAGKLGAVNADTIRAASTICKYFSTLLSSEQTEKAILCDGIQGICGKIQS